MQKPPARSSRQPVRRWCDRTNASFRQNRRTVSAVCIELHPAPSTRSVGGASAPWTRTPVGVTSTAADGGSGQRVGQDGVTVLVDRVDVDDEVGAVDRDSHRRLLAPPHDVGDQLLGRPEGEDGRADRHPVGQLGHQFDDGADILAGGVELDLHRGQQRVHRVDEHRRGLGVRRHAEPPGALAPGLFEDPQHRRIDACGRGGRLPKRQRSTPRLRRPVARTHALRSRRPRRARLRRALPADARRPTPGRAPVPWPRPRAPRALAAASASWAAARSSAAAVSSR